MALSSAQSPERQAKAIADENYEALKPQVVSTVRRKLGARRIHVDQSDLEESYCWAWFQIYVAIERGYSVWNLTGLLITVTSRRAVDIFREAHPGWHVDVEIDTCSAMVDLDEQLDNKIKLERCISAMAKRLNPRELKAIGLYHINGYRRADVAELLGLDRIQVERLMDGATKKIARVAAGINARGCVGEGEWARLLRAYARAAIPAEHRDHPRVVAHLKECESCSRYVDGLRG